MRVTSDALAKVPGWFDALDQALFSWFLSEQTAAGQTGDLAEIGVFKGKSAILIGDHLKLGEVFTVIDLFEDPSENPQTEAEQKAYAGLTQRVFEANYLRFHSHLPTVIRGESRREPVSTASCTSTDRISMRTYESIWSRHAASSARAESSRSTTSAPLTRPASPQPFGRRS